MYDGHPNTCSIPSIINTTQSLLYNISDIQEHPCLPYSALNTVDHT